MVKRIFILSGLIAFLGMDAQQKHTVEPKESPYGISKKYGLTLAELYELNPQIKDGVLGIGDILTVSKGGAKKATTKPSVSTTSNTSGKIGHIVLQPKQTIYGITKQYQISEADLRKLNPELDSHMRIGDKVALPLDKINKYGNGAEVAATTDIVENKVKENTSKTPTKEVSTKKEEEFYTVEAKDNYYKISRLFNITQKDLFKLNPGLEAKGLRPGDKIRVKGESNINVEENVESFDEYVPVEEEAKPSKSTTKSSAKTTSEKSSEATGDYITYTVKSGDTVFGITNKFNVGLDELIELNPALENGLKTGMVLKIKKQDPIYSKKSGDNLNVVLMLPFGFDANDNKYRTMSLDFLTGAKLAIERNVAKGMKLDITVIDAGNEKTFKSSISQLNQNNTDLIIGPFFKTNVIEVLDFVKDKKIPVVAPFANSEELYDYSNLIIVETNNDAYVGRLVKEVSKAYADEKIFIVADDSKVNANAIKAGLEKSLKKPNVTIVSSASDIILDENLMTGQSAPVIAILANEEDSVGNAFANKTIELSKEVEGVKAFSMYYHSIFEKKVDDLSKSNLVYFMDKKINTDGDFEKQVLADFKKKYCKTPGRYAVVGFDVVNDMLSRENKNGEIFKQIEKVQTQLATKFEFVRSKSNGAYVNNGFRVVKLVN